MIISGDELRKFLCVEYANPHDRLGMHRVMGGGSIVGIVARAYLQNAKTCSVVDVATGEKFPMKKLNESGFFETFIGTRREIFTHKFSVETYQGNVVSLGDPYAFLPTMSTFDCYLFGQGKHRHIGNCLGAHVREIDGVRGTSFAVWAPNAKRVSVVGDFNNWDGRYHSMRVLGASGVWELFIPELANFSKYKYELVGAHGELMLKSDPYGAYFECPPNNASIVFEASN
ncbi:MAG: hypothetical protein LBB18_03105, partial [Puniceicoccales bacterium]|nr:hypothetical protein [Puniceicoccales bacterium]